MEELNNFIKENRKSFPNYFRVKELKEYYNNEKLKMITLNHKTVGFYVLDGSQLKSLFITKDHRKTGLIDMVMLVIQQSQPYLTLALNKNSSRMMKFAKKFGFNETKRNVKGKTYNLTIFEYRCNT